MSEEILIDPIQKVDIGVCPSCLHKMIVVDTECNYFLVDKEGFPSGMETVYVRCEAVCKNCGNIIQMERSGLAYKPVSKTLDLENSCARKSELNHKKENNNESIWESHS